jgi:probable HAF family extracellular repeat protein
MRFCTEWGRAGPSVASRIVVWALAACVVFVEIGAAFSSQGAAPRTPHRVSARWEITELGRLRSGSEVRAFNSTGAVVGDVTPANSVARKPFGAFAWRHGRSTLLSTRPYSVAVAINERGQIVGNTDDTRGPVLWESASAKKPVRLLGLIATPEAINVHGQIAGERPDAAGNWHAVIWENATTLIDLGTLGGTFSEAFGINDLQQVVGTSSNDRGYNQAFLWQSGQMSSLIPPSPGGVSAVDSSGGIVLHRRFDPAAINDDGEVAGACVGKQLAADGNYVTHPCVWEAGKLLDLGRLTGDAVGAATGINDQDQVVGWVAAAANSTRRAFVWQNGIFTALPILPGGASVNEALAISDSGLILGVNESKNLSRVAVVQWTRKST